ncbi:permease-like cell division protein FtsX [Hathewaya proteolytica]|nr:permease-like cell division protein FtsX [Hathewaya proteolytica]
MKTNIGTIKYFVTESLKSLKRNKTLSIASIATVMATLFIFGVFLLSLVTIDNVVKQVGSDLQAAVYLKDDITKEQMDAIYAKISATAGVKHVNFRDKQAAFKDAQEMFGKNGEELVKGLEERNPFPMAFVITVEKPEFIQPVIDGVKDMAGIKNITEVTKAVAFIEKITKTVKIAGVALSSVLLVVSVFLIGNTIKLAVFSRKREIGIMKYVGATDWFIRWPFIIEGMLIGFIGSILSITVLFFVYKYLVFNTFITSAFFTLINPLYVLVSMAWKFIFGGVIIGALGSMFSIRKHLRV